VRIITTAFVVAALLLPAAAGAQTLERLRASGELRIGHRVDAAPYSYASPAGDARGYSIELCREVADRLADDLGIAPLTLAFVPVSAEDRFEAIEEGRIDLLCGATTATLARREVVDFSIATFVDGASVLYRTDGPASFEALSGERVGVRAATTTEEALRNTIEELGVDVVVVAVDDHDDGLARLEAGGIAAYFADRAILFHLGAESEAPEQLRLSERYFTIEPYALALPRGDSDFRLAVDRALSRIYRSGAIEAVFVRAFGPAAEPSELLEALYVLSPLPE